MALVLVACQPEGPASAKPSASQVAQPPDLIYLQDPAGPRMLEMDWSGTVLGAVAADGFSGPSPDGSRFLRSRDAVSAEDWRGRSLGALALNTSEYGLSTWADDGLHVCAIVFPANTGPDSGQGSLWIGAPGEKGRVIGPVGRPGSDPSVVACSVKNNRAIIAGGLMPHWPPGGTRYLITAEVQAVNLSTGAIEYERQYPLGNLGGQLESGPRGNWVLVAASPDGRWLAEIGVFTGMTEIREVSTGKQVATLPGGAVGFSSDGSRVVTNVNAGGTSEVQVVRWADHHVTWHGPGVAQSALARPSSSDFLIGITTAAGDMNAVVAVHGDGTAKIVVKNASVTWPCPCPAGM